MCERDDKIIFTYKIDSRRVHWEVNYVRIC